MNLKRELTLFDLVMFNIVAVIGLRWIAITAARGYSSLTLWLVAVIIFFIPQGLTVAELSSRFPKEGGLYYWTKLAFGDFHGFLSGWCYWTNNLIYYPSLLIFIARISVYVGGEHLIPLGESRLYVLLFSLIVLWIAIGLNIIGLRQGKWVENVGAIGVWLPAVILVVLGIISWAKYGISNPLSLKSLLPDFSSFNTISFFAVICFALSGIELAPIMSEEIKDPRKNIPRAIVIGGIIIGTIYLVGTLSLLLALPIKEINIISGVVQVIAKVGERVGFNLIGNVVAFLIVLGGLGAVGAWLIGTARIPFVAGLNKHLPQVLGKVHPRWHTPYVAILVQGGLSSLFLLMSFVGATVKEAYLVLLDTLIMVYFVPYLYMFASLIALRKTRDKDKGALLIPWGNLGVFLIGGLGFATTLLAIILAAVPPPEAKSALLYEVKVIGGLALFLALGGITYYHSISRRKKMPS
ncbi:MAG: amino acid permease [Acidobacteria bacterium]|nr:amino acid permease [Acidobacteriota bacterium]